MSLRKKIRSFFPSKKERTNTDKAEEMIQLYIKYIPQLKRLMYDDSTEVMSDGTLLGIMYDFHQNWDRTVGDNEMTMGAMPLLPSQPADFLQLPKETRSEVKPIAVQNELEHIPVPFVLDKLEEKIELFKRKSKLISQRYTKDQCDGFIKRLENRKHYEEHKSFFEQFPCTNNEKIDMLLAKYKLELNKSDMFVPTFPKDAISVMSEYSAITLKFIKEKPVFYVIAEEKDFIEKRRKLDPILLVQSPFGFYWQILGAWDKEMLLLSEL